MRHHIVFSSPSSFPGFVLSHDAGFVPQFGVKPLLYLHVKTVHVHQGHHPVLPHLHQLHPAV